MAEGEGSMPTTCNWSLLCADTEESHEGTLSAGDKAQLVIGFENGGRLTIDGEGNAVTVEGALTLKKIGHGDIEFAGSTEIGTTGIGAITGTGGTLTLTF
jgi:hypothetical protein